MQPLKIHPGATEPRALLWERWRGIVFIAVLASLIRAAIGRSCQQSQLQRRNAGKGCPYNLKRGAGPLPLGAKSLTPQPPLPQGEGEENQENRAHTETRRHGEEQSAKSGTNANPDGDPCHETHDRPEVELGFFPCHSAHLRKPGVPGGLVGHPIPICTTEAIHGKTSGALLFRPFSWAMQEKGQGNRGR